MAVISLATVGLTLSDLLDRVKAGEELVLTRAGEPVAMLVPIRPLLGQRRFGALRGVHSVGPEFFEPMAESELSAWE